MSENPIKEIIIVAGANGVGKTTFAQEFLDQYPHYEYLNADEIAKEISPENPQAKQFRAGKIFFERLNKFIEQGKSCVIESTLSGRYLIKFIGRIKEQNYQTTLAFIFVDSPEISIERIAGRVKKGGHFVPEEDVRRRFVRGRENFWNIYKNLVDRWSLIYNSQGGFREIAFGEKDTPKITDENLFNDFIENLK